MLNKEQKISLRLRAEAKLKEKGLCTKLPSSEKEIKALVRELQLQKIELELQNKALLQANEQVLHSQFKFKSWIESISDFIIVCDLDGIISYVNCEESLNDYIGCNFMHLLPDDDTQKSLKLIFSTIANKGHVDELEHQFLHNSIGNKRVYSSQFNPLYNTDGVACGVIVRIIDITAQNKTFQTLQYNKNQLEKLFESSPDLVFKTDLYTHKFIDVNQRALDYYGYTKEEFLKLNIFDIEVNQDLPKINQKSLKVGDVVETLGIHKCKDGKTFHANIHVCKLDDGHIATVRDISALIQVENQLLESEEYLRKGAEIAQFGFWKFFPDPGEIEGTKELLKIMELQEGFKYKKFTEHIHSDDFAFYKEHFDQGLKKGLHWDINYRLKFDDGRIKWIRSIGEPFLDKNSEVLYIIGVVQDITKEKLAELKIIESENNFRLINATINETFYLFDLTKGEYEYISPACAKVLGEEPAFFYEGNNHTDKYVIEQDKHLLRQCKKDALAGKVFSLEFRILYNGEIKWLREKSYPINDSNGQPLKHSGVVQDITEQKNIELELQESKEQFESLFETSPEAIYIHDFSTILNVNKAFLLQFGYEKKEDIIGKPSMASTFFKEDFPLVKALRSEFIAKGHIEIPPMRMLKCDGSSFLSEIHVSSILIRGKTHVQVISRDITERTKSERALIESENNFRLINETINDVFYLYNLVEKRYEYISPGCKRLLGADPKFFYEGGDYSLEFGFPKERIQREKAVIDLLEGMAFEIEFRAKINGEVRWLLEKSFPIFGENGKTIKNSGIVQDITARKQANKKIEDLKYALDEAAIVFVMDNQGVVISVNDKFCQVSQYVRDEILGKKYFDVIAGFHPDSFWNELRQTMKKGRIWTREIKNKAKDDSIYWLHTTLIPFLDENGESTQYISIGTDITNQKQLEDDLRESQKEAVRNAEIKENFLSNMSHEIRTPMNGVFGFSRLLLQTNINENQRKYAQSIYSSAESLLAVINDILDVSKMESGKFKIKTVEFDLHKKIENTLQILQVGIEQKKLGFKLDIDPNISPFIIGAPNRIAQVLINLIGNAIKFTERGSIRLSVKIKNEKSLFFEVVDTGIGIPKDKMDTIFESFTQVENYKTREYSGTGLGLRISRELVQLMGGQIGVKSVIHQGAVFYFTIPYMPCDTTSAQPINIHREPILFSKFKEELHILVVEDHPVNQELVIIYLNLINCTYDLAINGEEAVAKAAENKYDMILMDIQMPKMDGIEATKIIRLKDPKTPIIAMTAHALEKEMQKCLTVGMNDFLTKPFKVEQLRAFILKHIHGLDVNPKASAVAQKEDRIKDESMFDELLEEMGGDQELVNELLTVFKVEIVKFLEEIKIAIDTKDLKLMRSLRHQMKPSLILFRLDEQLKLVNDITSLFKEKASLDEINSQFHKLEDTIPKLLSQIDAELNK